LLSQPVFAVFLLTNGGTFVILHTVDAMRTLLPAFLIVGFFAAFSSSPAIATPRTTGLSGPEYAPVATNTEETDLSAAEEIDALPVDDPAALESEETGQALLTPLDLENFDIPVVLNDAVNKYIRFFSVTKHDLFDKWLRRTRRYAPVVREILKKHGLPEDLVYLAMIESGFNMRAYSRAKAAGPWQFINETGQRYGLTVNYWVDERRDLEKSTVAAARYLKDLFDQFGCWQLAAAGYNAGEGRVGKAIERHDTNDFWKLRSYNALPKETREYVPQIIAAAIIAKDPERFGFADVDEPAYDPAKIKVPGGVSLRGIANAGSLPLTELKFLNPEMLKGVTPPNRNGYIIKLPENADTGDVCKRVQASLADSRQIVGVIKHSVRKKDSLPRILKKYSIDSCDLALLNDQGEDLQIRKGQVLYIPRFASLRSKAIAVTPVEDSGDEITELPSRKEKAGRQNVVWSDDDERTLPVVTPSKVYRKSGSSAGSNQAKIRLARQGGAATQKTQARIARADKGHRSETKAHLASLTVKKSNRTNTLSNKKPRAQGQKSSHKRHG
jgi:membrane-bound lytic murein transglycosylase D